MNRHVVKDKHRAKLFYCKSRTSKTIDQFYSSWKSNPSHSSITLSQVCIMVSFDCKTKKLGENCLFLWRLFHIFLCKLAADQRLEIKRTLFCFGNNHLSAFQLTHILYWVKLYAKAIKIYQNINTARFNLNGTTFFDVWRSSPNCCESNEKSLRPRLSYMQCVFHYEQRLL